MTRIQNRASEPRTRGSMPRMPERGRNLYYFLNHYTYNSFRSGYQGKRTGKGRLPASRGEVNQAWWDEVEEYAEAWVNVLGRTGSFSPAAVRMFKDCLKNMCLAGMWSRSAHYYWCTLENSYPGQNLGQATVEQIAHRDKHLSQLKKFGRYADHTCKYYLLDWFNNLEESDGGFDEIPTNPIGADKIREYKLEGRIEHWDSQFEEYQKSLVAYKRKRDQERKAIAEHKAAMDTMGSQAPEQINSAFELPIRGAAARDLSEKSHDGGIPDTEIMEEEWDDDDGSEAMDLDEE